MLLSTSVVSTFVVLLLLPPLPNGSDYMAAIASTLALVVVGPFIFPLANGSAPLTTFAVTILVAFWLVFASNYYYWLTKNNLLSILGVSMAIWSGFGGCVAYIAITGSV